VRGTTAIPCGYADAGVLAPVPGSPLGVALAVAGNPRYGALDPRGAAIQAVVEANRNVAAVGARPLALTDCLNFGDAADPRQFGEFVAAIDGLAEAANALRTPFISGNVSLHNTSANGNAVPASPIVACIGSAHVAKVVTPSFKAAGAPLYLLGPRSDALGGTIVGQFIGGANEALAPIDYERVRGEIELLLEAIERGIVRAAHDISDGGVAAAVCEMAFVARDFGLGAKIDAPDGWASSAGAAGAWFGESGGFIVEVVDAHELHALARRRGVPAWPLGRVTAGRRLDFAGVAFSVDELYGAW
jgi:phosphoribosylformylglycinamidine synthase